MKQHFLTLELYVQRWSGLRQVMSLKHGVVVPEAAACTSSSTVKVQQLVGVSRGCLHPFSSSLLLVWRSSRLPVCLCLLQSFYTLPVISLSHQSGRKRSKVLIFFPFFSLLGFVFFSIHGSLCRWEGGGRSTGEGGGHSPLHAGGLLRLLTDSCMVMLII